MPVHRALALTLCALCLCGCMSRKRPVKPDPVRPARSSLSVWNQSEAPVVVSASGGARSVSVPPKASRTLQLPGGQAPPNLMVRNGQNGAAIYEGTPPAFAPRMVVGEQGVTFPFDPERYRGRPLEVTAVPTPARDVQTAGKP